MVLLMRLIFLFVFIYSIQYAFAKDETGVKVNKYLALYKPMTSNGHSLTGNIRYHYNIYASKLNNYRTIIVYLPPAYLKNNAQRYPVLYMHDGQNIFDKATSFNKRDEWKIDETAERLISDKKIEEIIVVGIYNTDKRLDEYSPFYDTNVKAGGLADEYLDFIINELKPLIDKKYRTKADRDNTAIMGSSLGGLLSVYAGLKYSHIFSKIGVVSPSIWWDGSAILKMVEKDGFNPLNKLTIWLDMGMKEGDVIENETISTAIRDSRKLRDALEKYVSKNLIELEYFEDPDGYHNELSWQRRVELQLKYLFGR